MSPMPMPDNLTETPHTKPTLKTERPKLHKVILLNDDFTPREFVVTVLKAEFHVSEDQANKIMITAHRRGVCVVAVFTRDVAETKATRATDAGKAKGYPLMFTTEPEESHGVIRCDRDARQRAAALPTAATPSRYHIEPSASSSSAEAEEAAEQRHAADTDFSTLSSVVLQADPVAAGGVGRAAHRHDAGQR